MGIISCGSLQTNGRITMTIQLTIPHLFFFIAGLLTLALVLAHIVDIGTILWLVVVSVYNIITKEIPKGVISIFKHPKYLCIMVILQCLLLGGWFSMSTTKTSDWGAFMLTEIVLAGIAFLFYPSR